MLCGRTRRNIGGNVALVKRISHWLDCRNIIISYKGRVLKKNKPRWKRFYACTYYYFGFQTEKWPPRFSRARSNCGCKGHWGMFQPHQYRSVGYRLLFPARTQCSSGRRAPEGDWCKYACALGFHWSHTSRCILPRLRHSTRHSLQRAFKSVLISWLHESF